MDASPATASCERIGELATQLSACAADIERFLAAEVGRLSSLYRHREASADARRGSHPGAADPVIAAVLTRFEQLETAASQAGEG